LSAPQQLRSSAARTPKDIDAVMAAQADLVDIAHTLRQVVRVKG
jgi:RNA-splicing ligase RtcB